MIFVKTRDSIAGKEPIPNKYTIAMGQLVWKACGDAGGGLIASAKDSDGNIIGLIQ